ncbi:hypothetical protein FRC09_014308 [Ceratobasidium sp. 395]|nr:hypothetical protein FRC09_014308 [Ceratobasidium sp. 395]
MRPDEGNTLTMVPYMLQTPSSLSNLSLAGAEALNTSSKRSSVHRLHSLFDFSCMDALNLQCPSYPAALTATALDLARLGLQMGPSGVGSVAVTKPHQAYDHDHQRIQSQSAISLSDLMIRKGGGSVKDKMCKRTSWSRHM